MKYRNLAVFAVILFLFVKAAAQTTTPETPEAREKRMQWWTDARFGIFLHWGLYSEAGGDWKGKPYRGNEHFMLYEKIPWREYGSVLGSRFDPQKFDADAWVRMARDAGMKYVVITAKHHDGFAMYNSPSSDYNIVKQTPFARDPLKDIAAACRKYDLKFCVYYSLGRDWQDPDVPTNWPVKGGRSNTWDYPDEAAKVLSRYIERKVKPQLRELLTQYGDIGIVWFDTYELVTPRQSEELKKLVLSIQPHCIVNNRIGGGFGDYAVMEQEIGNTIRTRPWESCITMSGMWGYNRYDSVWKSPELLVRQLTEIVSKGGNYLLNVGPKGDGSFPDHAIKRLSVLGKWMRINGEAIYGTKPWKTAGEIPDTITFTGPTAAGSSMQDVLNDATSKRIFPEIRFTAKKDIVYIFANSITGKKMAVKALGKISGQKISAVSLLGSGKKIKWNQKAEALVLPLPGLKNEAVNVRVFKVVLKS
ncbi:alpha-L-fucosidase [Niabella drilacis]|uniref:alpha-L-fucosidase n=1 Tax=Niabella drilacis (strain DSM 25811 / CCM 8410 / CCUG 62505 / LMG 26954 / E90) TaxID=1285928 RepID=A0A1G6L421_NIADE|nr:alpha-L-fucosidase [Niabella drilacis]SDC37954.1 alpha-L-fucosidase [Niabella drilacis]